MPKRYRVYRSKGPPPIPTILAFGPPRASTQNFQNYAPPPFMMDSYSPTYDSPSNSLDTSYGPPSMEYGPPKKEYGPPLASSMKPTIHKHVNDEILKSL